MMNQKEACMMQSNMRCSQMNQAQLLHWIDKVSFAVMEFTLYLDSHPRDRNAIECFNHYLCSAAGGIADVCRKIWTAHNRYSKSGRVLEMGGTAMAVGRRYLLNVEL